MNLQIGDPTALDWLVFVALNVAALAWYPEWATRFITRSTDPYDHEERRARAHFTLCVLLVVGLAPWLVLGLIS